MPSIVLLRVAITTLLLTILVVVISSTYPLRNLTEPMAREPLLLKEDASLI